jgi:peptidoglycan/LPS O-acetylase OafA/YrhL
LGRTGVGYFDSSSEGNALLHTWSLAVEEQFYLVFPFILWAAWQVFSRRGNPASAVRNALILVGLVSFALSWVLVAGVTDPLGAGELVAFYSAPTRAWQFAIGALLAAGVGSSLRKAPQARVASAIAGIALVAYAGIFYDAATAFPGVAALAPTIGTGLLIGAATSVTTNPISKLLATRPMQAIGDISYSWYLWHWPIIVFAIAYNQTSKWVPPLAAIASLLPAIASYRYIENPLRHGRAFTPLRTLALGAACIIMPVAASALLFVATPQIRDTAAAAQFESHVDSRSGCASGTPLNQLDEGECTWSVESPSGVAVLIGDSNAGHFSEGFIAAANELGMDAVVVTASGCAVIDLTVLLDGVEEVRCREFVTGSISALTDLQPDVVVLASAADLHIHHGDRQFLTDSGRITETEAERLAAWVPAIESTLVQLRTIETSVVLVNPVPRPGNAGGAPDASWLASGRGFIGASPVSREAAQSRRADVVTLQTQAADRADATAVDFFDTICTAETCEVWRDGNPVYRDRSHISVAESEGLAERWRSILLKATIQ